MQYIAKSQWTATHIQDKVNRNADGIEIQLLEKDLYTTLDKNYIIPDEYKNFNIVCVHTPLASDFDYDIETPIGTEMLIATASFANKISIIRQRPITIVCHVELPIARLQYMGVYESTLKLLDSLSGKYPNLIFCIENTVSKTFGFYDNIEIVKTLDKPNIKTCLDTCHALIIEGLSGYLTNYGEYKSSLDYETLERAFAKNSGYCHWLHLNNASLTSEGFGNGKGHGTSFTEKDLELLTYIKNLYYKYINGATICLEVREKNYLNCVNFSETLENCKKVF